MADRGQKRKSTQSLEASTKRLRIETPAEHGHFDDEEEDEYPDQNDESSGDEESHVVDTPITPFSPPRKFPSELKTIKCTFPGCSKTFNRPVRLTSHLRSHTNERPFICTYDECDKSYMQEKHLKQHIKGSHTHERSYQCDWEGCTKSFLTATRLRRHQDAHGGRERFRCTSYPPCSQTFRKHQTLQRHIRSDHLELAPFPCTYVDPVSSLPCNAGFDSAGSLRKHEDRIHGTLRFWCDECSTTTSNDIDGQVGGFTTKAELTKHIRTEHANCLFCDTKFFSQNELQQHIEAHHQPTAPKVPLASRKTIPCTEPDCTKTFTKNYNLSVHIRTAHRGERFICGQFDLSKSPFFSTWSPTQGCGNAFVSKVNLEDHIRTQHLNLPSLVNAKRIKKTKPIKNEDHDPDLVNLLTGAAYRENPHRSILCAVPGCQWLFTRDYDLKVHLRSKHGLEDVAAAAAIYGERTAAPDHEFYDDVEWEIQRRAEEGSPFWIGADGHDDDEGRRGDGAEVDSDGWRAEEEEMRRLIDLDAAAAGSEGEDFPPFVDPALRGV